MQTVSVKLCPPCPAVQTDCKGASRAQAELLKVQKSFGCAELGSRRSLKLVSFTRVFVHLQKLRKGLLGV